MRAVDLIGRKRDGGQLSADELSWMVGGFLTGEVAEAQMAALLMAGVLQGFSEAEARALTQVLLDSGETLDLSGLRGPTIDKHSTGGVSDGTTLLVAPLLAAAGAVVVKLSGRGLGHTGGTLDKLESIPGFRTALEPQEVLRIAEEIGCVVAAQTQKLVPADKALYALRDVTATVSSPALIASSVMSKKLASGADTIVLDVKAGDGAFMPDTAAAEQLARLCVSIGVGAGRRCAALVTAMDQPLGRAVGNAIEVAEAVELLGRPPAGRLAQVALELAVTGLAQSRGEQGDEAIATARSGLIKAWESGSALATLARMVEAQGGDPSVCERPREVLPAAAVTRRVVAQEAGRVVAVPARAVGELAAGLGAGRARKEDAVDPAVGVELRAEIGDQLEAGDEMAVVHARSQEEAERAAVRLGELIAVDPDGASGAEEPILRRIS
ncbi:MAG TPA: thymidine phosphorylase [Egibacteraceae bacterium]|nr:thymidine phosphorylase [Egibacteraceae bacterium]